MNRKNILQNYMIQRKKSLDSTEAVQWKTGEKKNIAGHNGG